MLEESDVVIIGQGPAGLQAAIHASRRKAKVILLGRAKASSLYRAHIENYCFLKGPIAGEEMLAEGRSQAQGFGASFIDEDAIEIIKRDNSYEVITEGGRHILAKAIILAMGVSKKGLKVPGEKEFIGRGVSYCVDCDAFFYRGKTVAVVGNGSAAATGALTLASIAKGVYLISKASDISEALRRQIEESQIIWYKGRWVKEIVGGKAVEGVVLDNGERIDVEGIFIELGAKGAIELVVRLGVELDKEHFSYIVTDKNQQTNVPGIYAAGDICGPPFQVAKAVGEGCIAGLEAAKYAKNKGGI